MLTDWERARVREAAKAGGTPTAYAGVRAAVKEGMSVGEQRLEAAGLIEVRQKRMYVTEAGRAALAET